MTLLPTKWTKTGDSSKPTFITHSMMSAKSCCSRKVLLVTGWIIAILIAAASYYIYLARLYLLDETYDVRGPKELSPVEKLTIRVYATENIQDINRFVLHYSICPVVNEIQIIWHALHKEPPHVDAFKYTTTHSKVSFHKLRPTALFESYFAPVAAETEGNFVVN
jgi:hypothetical protein